MLGEQIMMEARRGLRAARFATRVELRKRRPREGAGTK